MRVGAYPQARASMGRAKRMDHLPLVSVGVPVYNGEDDLPQAVESLLTQSYSSLEIIISDNASTDRTQQIALELAARDRRVRYHRLEKNIGARSNFDQLRYLATGEYFMWNGADDIRPPDAVKSLVGALMKNPEAVMAHGPIIARFGEREYHIPHSMDLSSARAGQRIRVLTAGMQHIAMEYGLYRLATLRESVYENKGRYGDDYLICLQTGFLGPIEYVSSPMIVYRVRAMPSGSPLGDDIPLTVPNLFAGANRMWKSWSVLTWGCCFILRFRQVDVRQRVVGALVHISAFVVRYKKRLAMDFLLISCSTLAAFLRTIWKYVRRVPSFRHLNSRM